MNKAMHPGHKKITIFTSALYNPVTTRPGHFEHALSGLAQTRPRIKGD